MRRRDFLKAIPAAVAVPFLPLVAGSEALEPAGENVLTTGLQEWDVQPVLNFEEQIQGIVSHNGDLYVYGDHMVHRVPLQ